jgi:glycogen debranching enzyme
MLPPEVVRKLRRRSTATLKKLVTSRGIYASTDNGKNGYFHALFGRDTAITASLILSAENLKGWRRFNRRAYHGLLHLRRWQGQRNNSATGEVLGKLPHEIHSPTSRNNETRQRTKFYIGRLWSLDPHDNLLKSWDSVDSTPLWIIAVVRWHNANHKAYQPNVLASLQLALEWCLGNLREYDGWAGYIGADQKPERHTNEWHNQGWKDSVDTYQYADGKPMRQPIKDVFVNACFWSALSYGADVFGSQNPSFAATLREQAARLKERFNDIEKGFLFRDRPSGRYFFAEALDAGNRQSRAITADVGMCLWAYHDNECIIKDMYLADVVNRILQPDIFNPQTGIRQYSLRSPAVRSTEGGYHHGDTYWPFVSGLITEGMAHFNFQKEAKQVAVAMLTGLNQFSSCIELYIRTPDGTYRPWAHPAKNQSSATDQAWTAAATYYATAFLMTAVPLDE